MDENYIGSYVPGTTPKAREDQLIAMAYDKVEERIKNDTVTGAELVQILKWGSTKETLERELMERDLQLKMAKTEALQSSKQIEELYKQAMSAMRTYQGLSSDDQDI